LPGQQLPEGLYVEKIGEYQGHSVVKTVGIREKMKKITAKNSSFSV
jgi:hypothetical protein